MWDDIKFWVFVTPSLMIWALVIFPGNLIVGILEAYTPLWTLNYSLLDLISGIMSLAVWLTIGFGVFYWMT